MELRPQPGPALLPFSPDVEALDLVGAAIGAALGGFIQVQRSLCEGRRRRGDFVRTGGDPTGITDMMVGVTRGNERKMANEFSPSKAPATTKASERFDYARGRVFAQALLLPCLERR